MRVRSWALAVVTTRVPVTAPFPDVSEHVVQPPVVRLLGSDFVGPVLGIRPMPSDVAQIAAERG